MGLNCLNHPGFSPGPRMDRMWSPWRTGSCWPWKPAMHSSSQPRRQEPSTLLTHPQNFPPFSWVVTQVCYGATKQMPSVSFKHTYSSPLSRTTQAVLEAAPGPPTCTSTTTHTAWSSLVFFPNWIHCLRTLSISALKIQSCPRNKDRCILKVHTRKRKTPGCRGRCMVWSHFYKNKERKQQKVLHMNSCLKILKTNIRKILAPWLV